MFLKYNWPGIIWIIIILLLTCLPGNFFPHVPSISDILSPGNLIHILMFVILVLFLIDGFRRQYAIILLRYKPIIISITIGLFFGALTEIMQGVLNIGRTASLYDFIADAIGCCIAYFIYLFYFRKKWKIN